MRRGEVLAGSKTALVTGASKGIGRCYALRLAELGYNVLMVASGEAELVAAAEVVARVNPNVWVKYLVKDLATQTAAQEMFAYTEKANIKVDVLINNAGIFSFCDILNTPVERIERVLFLHCHVASGVVFYYVYFLFLRNRGRLICL